MCAYRTEGYGQCQKKNRKCTDFSAPHEVDRFRFAYLCGWMDYPSNYNLRNLGQPVCPRNALVSASMASFRCMCRSTPTGGCRSLGIAISTPETSSHNRNTIRHILTLGALMSNIEATRNERREEPAGSASKRSYGLLLFTKSRDILKSPGSSPSRPGEKRTKFGEYKR